jgi:hypothetical protein
MKFTFGFGFNFFFSFFGEVGIRIFLKPNTKKSQKFQPIFMKTSPLSPRGGENRPSGAG